MKFKKYLEGFEDPSKELDRIAVVTGLSYATLRPMGRGAEAGTVKTAKAISAATDGKVTVNELLGLEI